VNIAIVDDVAGAVLDAWPFLVGWTLGWLALWRLRPLPDAGPPTARSERPAVAVIVPARDEAHALHRLLPQLLAGARPGDEIVVVDDHSTDGTGDVARSLGARVATPPEPPDGWLGKPNACWHGAGTTSAPVLLFVDADVRPSVDLVDRIAAAVLSHPGTVVSVQPWHRVERPVEQLNVLFNVTSLMGVGAFTVLGRRVHPRAAFGPVLALERSTYERVGGHAAPSVRGEHTEDIALARAVGHAELHTGRPDIVFRMYPGGVGALVGGWTRSIATGAWSAPWWAVAATVAWVWSLAGGWIADPWTYPLAAVQVWVLGRRAGSFSPWIASVFPVAVVVLLVVVVRSAVLRLLGRDVTWKRRRVPSR
jgi:4,4'-diaponeurosporenoate glycosyltransferase